MAIMPDNLLGATQQAVGANETATVVSEAFNISEAESVYFRADLTVSSVTATTGITAFLQDSSDGGTVWTTASQATAITADGLISVTVKPEVAGDQGFIPLRTKGRICITTGAGDAVDVDAVRVARRRR